MVEYEIGRTPELDRRQKVESLIRYAGHRLILDADILKRGKEIGEIGFGAYDALHLACAEHGNADVFLTTDDRLLMLATEKAELLGVKVDNPLIWLKGVV